MKAFPTTKPLDSWDDPNQGMDLRDYFAAKAMQSFLSHLVEEGWDADDLELVAETSYRMADAMLKARTE